MIYLDNAATTQVRDNVLHAMLPYFKEQYGNPGSIYKFGRAAREAVEDAREKVAQMFSCSPEHIVFTSGGSEGNNFVLRGVADYLKSIGKTHIIVSAIEHDSVLNAAKLLEKDGFTVTLVKPNTNGYVGYAHVREQIKPETGLVSVMYANNETGVVNGVEDIGWMCNKTGVLFHCDCVQAAGLYDLNRSRFHFDFATISGHKIHAPKGIGAVYVRDPSMLSPLIAGGSTQEFGLRGGTENVPYIVGFGAACDMISKDRENYAALRKKMRILQEHFLSTLNMYDGVRYELNTEDPSAREGKVISICFPDVDNETLIFALETQGIYVSAGSACTAHETSPSHVLTAMGIPDEKARSTIRVSFNTMLSKEDVVSAAAKIAETILIMKSI